MNKKGFTLVELIAVVVIIGIIAVIATPNIVNMIDNGKKDQFIADAKEMISKAKYQIKLDKYWENGVFETEGDCTVTNAEKLGFANMTDADGNSYVLSECKVKMCIENNKQVYYVITKTLSSNPDKSSRGIYNNEPDTGGYVSEAKLIATSDDADPYDYVVALSK